MRPTSLLVPPDPAMNNIYKSAIAKKKTKPIERAGKGYQRTIPHRTCIIITIILADVASA